MDDMMPHVKGTEAMKQIKKTDNKTPIIVVTANAIEGSKEKYLNEGFDFYLAKPIIKQELDECINNFLK